MKYFLQQICKDKAWDIKLLRNIFTASNEICQKAVINLTKTLILDEESNSLEYFEKVLYFQEKYNPKESTSIRSKCLTKLGDIYKDRHLYEKATEFYLAAIKINHKLAEPFEKLRDEHLQAYTVEKVEGLLLYTISDYNEDLLTELIQENIIKFINKLIQRLTNDETVLQEYPNMKEVSVAFYVDIIDLQDLCLNILEITNVLVDLQRYLENLQKMFLILRKYFVVDERIEQRIESLASYVAFIYKNTEGYEHLESWVQMFEFPSFLPKLQSHLKQFQISSESNQEDCIRMLEILNGFENSQEFNKSKGECYFQLGILYKKNNLFEPAISCFAKALSENSEICDAYRNLGEIFFQINQSELAFECYRYIHDSIKALESIKQMINNIPRNSQAHSMKAKYLVELWRYDEAVKTYQDAISYESSIKIQNSYFQEITHVWKNSKKKYSIVKGLSQRTCIRPQEEFQTLLSQLMKKMVNINELSNCCPQIKRVESSYQLRIFEEMRQKRRIQQTRKFEKRITKIENEIDSRIKPGKKEMSLEVNVQKR